MHLLHPSLYMYNYYVCFQSFEDYLCESSLPPLDSRTEEGYAATSTLCLQQCSLPPTCTCNDKSNNINNIITLLLLYVIVVVLLFASDVIKSSRQLNGKSIQPEFGGPGFDSQLNLNFFLFPKQCMQLHCSHIHLHTIVLIVYCCYLHSYNDSFYFGVRYWRMLAVRCYRNGETMAVVQMHPQQLTEVHVYTDYPVALEYIRICAFSMAPFLLSFM